MASNDHAKIPAHFVPEFHFQLFSDYLSFLEKPDNSALSSAGIHHSSEPVFRAFIAVCGQDPDLEFIVRMI